jgi:tetratricopeptide (TPR) repeat protein
VVPGSASSSVPALRPAGGPPSRGDLNALLARANLLRMRGQWPEAVERCTEALRLDPHSAAAHSLLGDIYENQGRLDKAIHWYEQALDQDPESVADKAKLTRARELQAVRRRTREPRLSWAYLVSVAGVAFLFVAFVMAALVAPDRRTTVSTVLQNAPDPSYPAVAVPKVKPPDHTTEEDALRQSLLDDLHSEYMYVTAAMLNPLESEATVTVQLRDRPVTPDPMGGGRRGRILREGYRIADLAHRFRQKRNQDLRFVNIRALAQLSSGSGAGTTEEVWRGRINVARLGVPDDRASAAEVRDSYDPDPNRMFWNPVAGF